ncbi:MAG: FAD-binding protein [Gammaproteobacteria bacterium]|nr:FAD-binding protein [Gammaproteobacteria bacterium]
MRTYQIAVIGSGAAGLMAAITASCQSDCILITDGPVGRSNSVMAQGGLQLPFPSPESRKKFFDDIIRSARTELDQGLVLHFVNQVNATVDRLISWGLELDRDQQGEFIRRMAGGLSEARIVSVKDQIGPAIIKILRDKLQHCDIEIQEHSRVIDLKPDNEFINIRINSTKDDYAEIRSRAVICCTGGITYYEAQRRRAPTTNPANENHIVFDILCRLGLPTVHTDYYQFQPFGIVTGNQENPGKCVPESIVNFPVRILDRHNHDLGDIRQDRLALTERMFKSKADGDAVILEDGRTGFWLTLEDIDPVQLERTYPKLYGNLKHMNLLTQNVLIFPFLHYYLGGVKINARCETLIPGLFLAGEITGGMHGRNRLMGNGITDSLVHGEVAARSACEYISR